MNENLADGFLSKISGYKIPKEMMYILMKHLGKSIRKSSTELADSVTLGTVNKILKRLGTNPAKTRFPGSGRLVPDTSSSMMQKFKRIKKPGWKKIYRRARKEVSDLIGGADKPLSKRQQSIINTPAHESALHRLSPDHFSEDLRVIRVLAIRALEKKKGKKLTGVPMFGARRVRQQY